jgi:hypothetical protein
MPVWPTLRDGPAGLLRVRLDVLALPQCRLQTIDKGAAVERLAEEADGAGQLGALAEPGFRVTSHKNDRQMQTTFGQLVQQLQAVHSWHQHVGNQAGRVFRSWISQKLFGA